MKPTTLKLAVFAGLVLLLLSGCGTQGRYQINLITEGRHTISETLYGDLVVFGGEITVEPGSRLLGSLHVLQGQVTLGGQVDGNTAVMGGELVLQPGAAIFGDLNQGGGKISGLQADMVAGQITADPDVRLPDETLDRRRSQTTPLPALLGSLLGAVLAVLLKRFVPRQLDLTADAALHHPIVSGSMGILVGIVGLSLLVLMAYTILLIPVTMLGLLVLGLAVVFGWLACAVQVSNLLQRAWKVGRGTAFFDFAVVFACLAGLSLLGFLPLLGILLQLLAVVVGLGATFLTRFGTHPFTPAQ